MSGAQGCCGTALPSAARTRLAFATDVRKGAAQQAAERAGTTLPRRRRACVRSVHWANEGLRGLDFRRPGTVTLLRSVGATPVLATAERWARACFQEAWRPEARGATSARAEGR